MKAEHDPLASHIFYFAPPLSERQRYEERKAPRDDGPGEFQYRLRPWLSRQPRRMGAPHGSCYETVNDCSTTIAFFREPRLNDKRAAMRRLANVTNG